MNAASIEEFETAKRLAEASSIFSRESGRFPLTGRGDVNTYALFAEYSPASAGQVWDHCAHWYRHGRNYC